MELVREGEAVIKRNREYPKREKGLECGLAAEAAIVLLQGFGEIGSGLKRMMDDFVA